MLEEDGPTISAPEIIWPCFEMNYEGEYGDGDKDVFSGWDNVIQNYIIQENLKDINGIVLGSKKFWDCFAKSIEITFVDNFFDEYTYM